LNDSVSFFQRRKKHLKGKVKEEDEEGIRKINGPRPKGFL